MFMITQDTMLTMLLFVQWSGLIQIAHINTMMISAPEELSLFVNHAKVLYMI